MRVSTRSIISTAEPKRKSKFVRYLSIFLFVIAIIQVILLAITFIFARGLILRQGPALDADAVNYIPWYRSWNIRSVDETYRLQGWYCESGQSNSPTVIIVPGYNNNRLPAGNLTGDMMQQLVARNYNVLTVDPRYTGSSGGNSQSFGYLESLDLLMVLDHLKGRREEVDIIIYAIGAGSNTAIRAYTQLEAMERRTFSYPRNNTVRTNLENLTLRTKDIKAWIFDAPQPFGDDYISHEIRRNAPFGHQLWALTVPWAVRISAGMAGNTPILETISTISEPILILAPTAGSSDYSEGTNLIVERRQRLFPDTTAVTVIDMTDKENLLSAAPTKVTEAILDFLGRFLK
ncbi:MAG: alpha/beta hydrolase [Clostridiaceae bacterium]|nr:alpha/beta hydrolase [Clostridiaceae bacterium]